jgi:hypothetical protein
VAIMTDTPRAAEDQQQEVVGLVRTYDAGASFNNQEAPAAGVLSSIMAARVLSASDSPKKNHRQAARLSVPDFTIILKVLFILFYFKHLNALLEHQHSLGSFLVSWQSCTTIRAFKFQICFLAYGRKLVIENLSSLNYVVCRFCRR